MPASHDAGSGSLFLQDSSSNWPYDAAAGNTATAGAVLWSGASVALLLFALAMILYFYHRYRWRLSTSRALRSGSMSDQALDTIATGHCEVLCHCDASVLAQTVLGGKMAHDYADGSSFYGIALADWLTFQIARAWHLQLAIFWIATAWLGMGIFIAPLVSGSEPKGQKHLVNVLFGALVTVVVGSLAGEYLPLIKACSASIVVVAWNARMGIPGAWPPLDVSADRRHGHLVVHRVSGLARSAPRPKAIAAVSRIYCSTRRRLQWRSMGRFGCSGVATVGARDSPALVAMAMTNRKQAGQMFTRSRSDFVPAVAAEKERIVSECKQAPHRGESSQFWERVKRV